MTLSEFIIRYRNRHSLSQRQFAKLCGLSNGYISLLEKGHKANNDKPIVPTVQAYLQIADGMGISIQELFDSIDDSPVSLDYDSFDPQRKIPILGQIACGSPILAEENFDGFVNLPVTVKADFALTCKGDSMITARIFDGDIVFIRQQPDVDDGDIAAVLIGDETTLKKVKHYPNRLVLCPCNPMYQEMVFRDEELNDVRILGKAVWFLSEVRK